MPIRKNTGRCLIPNCNNPAQEAKIHNGKYTVYRKYCPTHWSRWMRFKDPYFVPEMKMPALKRLNLRAIKKDNGCIEYNGSINGSGYCTISHDGINEVANRYVWMCFFGDIPEDQYVLHKCDNRRCINIDHLFLGTKKDNAVDMVNKGRSLWGEKHRSCKLKKEQVIEIFNSDESAKNLSKKYNISIQTIYGIRHNRVWKQLKLRRA